MRVYGKTIYALALMFLWSGFVQEAFAAGEITGAVTFGGTPPKNPKIAVAKNSDYCGSEIEQPLLVVNSQNKGVQFTVVYLEGVEAGAAAAPTKPVLRMGAPERKCDFVEHVSAIRKGGDLEMKNQDPVLHNPHPFNEKGATVFNLALTEQGQTVTKKIRTGGVMRLQCDSHVHMNGWILSFEHPYYAVTDANGNFKIEGVPPGKYKLTAWHESWTVKNWDEVTHERKEAEDAVKAGKMKMEDAQLARPTFADPIVLTKEIEVKDGVVKANFELK